MVGESNMDIYMYQQLYRNKLVEKPLPHLFSGLSHVFLTFSNKALN